MQVSVSSLGVSQRSDDAHEDANGVSDHPEVVQREPNTHRQRPSVHILLLLQRTGEACHIGLKLVLAGSLFKHIYIQQPWSDDFIVLYICICILPVYWQVYTLFLKCVLLSRPDCIVPPWLNNRFFYFLFRSELLLFLLFTSHPSTRLFHLFKSTIFTVVLCAVFLLLSFGGMCPSLTLLWSVLSNQKPPLSAPRRWSVQTVHDCPVLTSAPPSHLFSLSSTCSNAKCFVALKHFIPLLSYISRGHITAHHLALHFLFWKNSVLI